MAIIHVRILKLWPPPSF